MKKTLFIVLGLSFAFIVNAQVSKTVNCTAGGLSSLLTQQDYYTVTNLTISGVMDARDFKTIKLNMLGVLTTLNIRDVTIVEYTGTDGPYNANLTYPANTIPQYCFSNGSSTVLASITLPTSITAIGSSAFSSCEKLTTISLPSLVTDIGEYAFSGCYGLQDIYMPSTLSSIGNGAFGFCKNIISISLPSSVSTISTGLFQGCSKLSNFIVPSTIDSIGDFAFSSCTGLQTISIPESITQIGYSAFSDCSSLQSITIPSKVTKLNSFVFKNCSTLTSIVVPASVNSIDQEVFYGCKASISLPATTIDWHYSAFRGCAGSITVNANSTIFSSVNGVLFQKIKGILIRCPSSKTGSYVIPSTVYSINSYAFEDCKNLTSLTIPSTVSVIDNYGAGLVFANCTALTSLITYSSKPIISQFSTNNFDNIDKSKCTLFVPEGSKAAYQTAAQWKDFVNIEEFASVKTIQNSAGSLSSKINSNVRSFLTNLTVIGTIDARDFKTIRDSLPGLSIVDLSGATIVAYNGTNGPAGIVITSYANDVVPNSAFYYKSNFTSIILPATATTIDSYAFYNCSKLSSISSSNALIAIGQRAFYNCTSASSINLSAPLQSIGDYAFFGCSGAKTVTIPSSVTTIGAQAFTGCKSLTSVSIPGSITSLGSSAFSSCDSLVSATLLTPISMVGESMFSSCYKLQSVTLPNTIKTIGTSAFSYCYVLPTITIPSSVTSIGDFAFYTCSKLSSFTIPSSVISLGAASFSNCTTLTNMIIPSSITTIPNNLFWGCTSLQSVTLPSSITSIGNIAFYNCTGLTSIYSYSEIPADLSASTTVFYNVNKTNCTLYIPFGSKSNYQNAVQWQDFLNKTENLNGIGLASSTVSVANAEGSTNTVALTSNVSWSATSNQSWLQVSPATGSNSGILTFTASKNTGISRTAIVTIKSSGLSDKTITVTQAGALTINTTSVTLASTAGSTNSIEISSTISWTASSNQSWLTVKSTSGSSNAVVDFTATFNGGGVRTAIVTIKASGLPDQTVTVTQESGLPAVTLYPSMSIYAPVIDQQSTKLICNLTTKYLRFMPVVSGTYTFTSVSNIDPVAKLYDNTHATLASGDDSNGNLNFDFSYNLVAGSIYYLGINNYNGDNNIITLNITGGPLQGFVFTDYNGWNSTSCWNWGVLPAARNNVYIDGTVIIDQNVSVTNLTIAPNATVIVYNGVTIDYSNLYLQSDASGTASIISDNVGMTATVEQYLTGSGNATPNGRGYYISSPISSAKSSVVSASGGNGLWSHDEAKGYTEISDDVTTLNPFNGYVTRVGKDTVITFTGTLNTGTFTKQNLTRTGTTNVKRGFHLIGNPYPSSVDWASATKVNLMPSIWYRTWNGSSMVFDTYNASSGVGTNNNGNGAVTQYIPPMQAIWVRVDGDGKTGSLTFDNSMRTDIYHNSLKSNKTKDIVHIQVSNGKNSDEAILVFNANAKNTFDEYDSQKMFADNANIPQLYSLADAEKLVINGLASVETNQVIPLGFKTAKAGTYTISANEIEGLAGVPVVLEDKLLHNTQDLTQTPSYTFSSDSIDNARRFVLHLKVGSETTESSIKQNAVSIYERHKGIVVATTETSGTIIVSDVLGRVVTTESIVGTETKVAVPAGVYFVKVQTDTVLETKELIVE
jgi:hypothetical protein